MRPFFAITWLAASFSMAAASAEAIEASSQAVPLCPPPFDGGSICTIDPDDCRVEGHGCSSGLMCCNTGGCGNYKCVRPR
ncbi:hypothetical protein N7471_011289 [Penicillium samsonianum]|uniref:uncharacterized protein n=1 Tax=Penicillium samsonianum TaxID=1882272 RepID=UPI00254830F7|nr:uncharacterized protein N7471_011289 [Penicillium samsonianum]KAJ6123972.1 hypothetical protein N7471_011289 [Penicillium samsonianum]